MTDTRTALAEESLAEAVFDTYGLREGSAELSLRLAERGVLLVTRQFVVDVAALPMLPGITLGEVAVIQYARHALRAALSGEVA